MKHSGRFPMGSMPIWEEDGETICQGLTILRMVGKRTGFYSNDPNVAWQIDSAAEHVEDQMGAYNTYAQGFAGRGSFTQEDIDALKPGLEKVAKMVHNRISKHGKKYIAGTDKPTIADFKAASFVMATVANDMAPLGDFRQQLKDVINKYPMAKAYFMDTIPATLGSYKIMAPC